MLKSPSLVAFFNSQLSIELKLAYRNRASLTNPVLFFVIVISLFPFGVGPDASTLAKIAPGVLWVAALLSSLLALDHLFHSDFSDGRLEQMLLSPHPLFLIALSKTTAHWLTTGLPLVIVSPLLGVFLNLPDHAMSTLIVSLLIGTPTLSLLGGIGAALTVGISHGGLLLSLVIMPLYVPVLIFGASSVQAASIGLNPIGHLYLLAAMLVLALTLAPMAIAAALRISSN